VLIFVTRMDDMDLTGVCNESNEDATRLHWQTSSSSSEGSGEEDSSSDDNPSTPIPPRQRKTSDDLDADYIPNEEEVNRNQPDNLNYVASKICPYIKGHQLFEYIGLK
jgi:hypothetical protein